MLQTLFIRESLETMGVYQANPSLLEELPNENPS
jgi:hypothetical protein